MARGKYLSLAEARKLKKLDRFCKEHPSQGDEKLFDRVLDAMAQSRPPRRKSKSSKEGEQT